MYLLLHFYVIEKKRKGTAKPQAVEIGLTIFKCIKSGINASPLKIKNNDEIQHHDREEKMQLNKRAADFEHS